MRKVILDTETTGLNLDKDRIIEIACIELLNEIPSGEIFHRHYSPGNLIVSKEAENIHGFSNEFLKDFDLFDESLEEVLDFIKDSPLIIHNASFDLGMLNSSFQRMNIEKINEDRAICTVTLARKMFPGSKVNLNALCRKYGISLENRVKHDAVTDCYLLSQVYLELIGGKQNKFNFKQNENIQESKKSFEKFSAKTPLIEISEHETKLHKKMLLNIPKSLWEKTDY